MNKLRAEGADEARRLVQPRCHNRDCVEVPSPYLMARWTSFMRTCRTGVTRTRRATAVSARPATANPYWSAARPYNGRSQRRDASLDQTVTCSSARQGKVLYWNTGLHADDPDVVRTLKTPTFRTTARVWYKGSHAPMEQSASDDDLREHLIQSRETRLELRLQRFPRQRYRRPHPRFQDSLDLPRDGKARVADRALPASLLQAQLAGVRRVRVLRLGVHRGLARWSPVRLLRDGAGELRVRARPDRRVHQPTRRQRGLDWRSGSPARPPCSPTATAAPIELRNQLAAPSFSTILIVSGDRRVSAEAVALSTERVLMTAAHRTESYLLANLSPSTSA